MKSLGRKENCGIPVGKGILEDQTLVGNVFIIDDQMKFKSSNMLCYSGITEINDIIYDEKYPDYCRLDVLFDESRKGRFVKDKYPVLLNIHGGGWLAGDKSYRRGYSMMFAHEGFLVVNINYCFVPKFKFPVLVQNVSAALKWIYENKDKYDLDLENVSVCGDSAGGHLSAMALVCQQNKEVREKLGVEEPKVRISKAIFHSSVLFFDKSIFYLPVVNGMIRSLTGIKNKKDYSKYEYADVISPVKYMDKNYPEIMIVTGRTDYFTKYQNMDLVKKLESEGAKYRYHHCKTFLNSFHCFHLKPWMSGANKACHECVKFLMEDLVADKKELDSVLSYKEFKKQLNKKT